MNPRIGYISACYPKLSETFVYREVLGVRGRLGEVPVVSVNPSDVDRGDPGLPEGVGDDVIELYGRGWERLLWDGLVGFGRRPVGGCRVMALAFRDVVRGGDLRGLKGRLKVLGQAWAAIAVGRELGARGVVHLHAQMAHVPTTVAMYAARYLGIGFSFTGHAADLFRDRGLLAEKLLRSTHVHCISEWHRGFYNRIVGRAVEDYPVVRCGVEGDRYSFVRREAVGDPPVLLGVGRLVSKKGFDLAIRTVGALSRGGTFVRLRLIGDGPERGALEALGAAEGVADRVVFEGARGNPEVAAAMGEADVFVLPCRVAADGDKDGIPVVLMEAMARGLPVISGDLETIRELVVPGETGWMVPAGDVDALVAAIREVCGDREEREVRVQAARDRVEREFFLDPNIDRLCNALVAHGVPVEGVRSG